MIPSELVCVLCEFFTVGNLLELIALLVPKLGSATTKYRPYVVEILTTLFSYLSSRSVPDARNALVSLLLCVREVIDLLEAGNAARPFNVTCLGGKISLVDEESFLRFSFRLVSSVVKSMSVFLQDQSFLVWSMACSCVLLKPFSQDLVFEAVQCMKVMSEWSRAPLHCHDLLLSFLCHVLRPKAGFLLRQDIEDALSSFFDVIIPDLSPKSLHLVRDSFFAVAPGAISMTSSRSFASSLLRLLRALGQDEPLSIVPNLMPLIERLDDQETLLACFHGCSPSIFLDFLSHYQVSSSHDASTLLNVTRVVTFLSLWIVLGTEEDRKVLASVSEKLVALCRHLVKKLRAKDRSYVPHAVLVFRLVADHANECSVFGEEFRETFSDLCCLDWLEHIRSNVDVQDFEIDAVSVRFQALARLPDASFQAKARQHIFSGLASAKSLIHNMASHALRQFLMHVQPAMCEDVANDIMTLISKGCTPGHTAQLLRSFGCCVCAAADGLIWVNGASKCKLCDDMALQRLKNHQFRCVPASKKWKSFLVWLEKHNEADSEVMVAQLDVFGRFLRHADFPMDEMSDFVEKRVMHYATHDDIAVRKAFVHIVPSICVCLPGLVSSLVPFLGSSIVTPRIQTTILQSMAQVAICVPQKSSWFVPAFYSLVGAFLHPDLMVRAVAFDCVRDVAQANGLTEQALFEKHQDEISFILVKELAKTPQLWDEVAHYLDQTPSELLKRTAPFWLPKLVARPGVDDILQIVARMLNVTTHFLIATKETCIPVCLHILIEEAGHEHAAQVVAQHTNKTIDFVMDCYAHYLMRELILLLGDSDSTVMSKCIRGIHRLALAHYRVSKKSERNTPLTEGELAEFVAGRFLAIVENVDGNLLPSTDPLGDRRSPILGLDQLLTIMAKGAKSHFVALRPKVMATLKQALRQPDLRRDACDVLARFLQNLGVDNIGPFLGQLVADLLPYVTQDVSLETSERVIQILEWLLVENASQLRKYFADVHFIPDIPELARVIKVLELQTSLGKRRIDDVLRQLKSGLEHETLSVRLHAVKKLMSVLRENHAEISKKILTGTRVDPLIEEIVRLLLVGSRGSISSDVRSQYAACIGLLGAIDPGRVDMRFRSELQVELKVVGLASDLICNFFVPMLEDAKHQETQRRAAYAIQGILKACGCSSSTPSLASALPADKDDEISNPSVALWRTLSTRVKVIVSPYLSSCYDIHFVPPVRVGTFYRSSTTYRKWVGSFAGYLLHHVTTPRMNELLGACHASVKDYEMNARFLLPYVMLHVADQPEDFKVMKEELAAVLEAEVPKSADMSQLCFQTVFHLIDVLSHWVEQVKKGKNNGAAVNKQPKRATAKNGGPAKTDALFSDTPQQKYDAINRLITEIPRMLIAKAALKCGAFARALKYIEGHVRESGPRFKSVLIEVVPFLQQIYGGLEDSDALQGLSRIKRSVHPEEQIVELEHRGNWAHALDWYDVAILKNPCDSELRFGQIRCMLNLGRFETMLALVQSAQMLNFSREEESSSFLSGSAGSRRESLAAAAVSSRQPVMVAEEEPSSVFGQAASASDQLLSYGVQAAWRLSDWDQVGQHVQDAGTSKLLREDFEMNIARCLLQVVREDHGTFREAIQQARAQVMGPLLAASMDSYQRCFPFLVNLHMLFELEEMGGIVLNSGDLRMLNEAEETSWNARLKMTSSSFRFRQGILHLRRVVSGIGGDVSSKAWVEIARAARNDGQLDSCRAALVQALAIDPVDLDALIERSKLWYLEGHEPAAIHEMEQVIEVAQGRNKVTNNVRESDIRMKRQLAKAELLLGRWLNETGQKPSAEIRAQFERVTSLSPKWEAGHFFLATFLDKVVRSNEEDDSTQPKEAFVKLLPEIIQSYRLSLQCGYKHIHQSLPRMLTLIFRYGRELYLEMQSKQREEVWKVVDQRLTEEMNHAINNIPSYVWVGAVPQLISRVCHDNPSVKLFVSSILTKVFEHFPEQFLWSAMGVIRSKHRLHAKAELTSIVTKAAERRVELKKAYEDARKVASLIGCLCKVSVQGAPNRVSMSSVPELKKWLDITNPHVIVPTEATMVGSLPLSGAPEANFDPFGSSNVRIHKVMDEFEVLKSLQCPKVCTFIGTNGLQYKFLAKPKDDLRKDSRVMEINSLVNKLLARDNDCHRRQLRIQTYAVTPLDEETGLIEWVPNLITYRTAAAQLPEFLKAAKDKYEALKAMVPGERYRQVMDVCPPLFYQWFLTRFPEPMSWLDARLCYTRSAAVMSMVGTVIGLGDRHGENILLDVKTGHVVHVDFNAIFHKGETFTVPERVPFRLTENMVDAMGLTRYEGSFRRTCEMTMKVMRKNKEMVLSVLETFLHDPLLEFCMDKSSAAAKDKKVKKDGRGPGEGESVNEKAREIIGKIERTLTGKINQSAWEKEGQKTSVAKVMMSASRAVALSVEGHVEFLIQQATDPSNLGAMYTGWQPFL